MVNKSVYLAGPISGLDYNGATDWRIDAKLSLNEAGIEAFSPMRAKEYLSHVKDFTDNGEDDFADLSCLSANRGIMTRDRFDATRCSVLLAHLGGAKKVSTGTVMEIAWADLSRIPIVAVLEEGNPHVHGMILEAIGFRVDTLEQALDVIKAILVA